MNKTFWYFSVIYTAVCSQYTAPVGYFVIASQDKFFPAFDAQAMVESKKIIGDYDSPSIIFKCLISEEQYNKFKK